MEDINIQFFSTRKSFIPTRKKNHEQSERTYYIGFQILLIKGLCNNQ